jgi:hypothetical protein
MTVAPTTGRLAELSLAKILIWVSYKLSSRFKFENDSILMELKTNKPCFTMVVVVLFSAIY